MSGFSADWLSLREPADARARNKTVIESMARHFRGRSSLTVIDLACGRGALLRALSPYLPPRQHWHLVDMDATLLAEAAHGASAAIPTETHRRELDRDLEPVLAIRADLVVSSAFLDLVSDAWLARLVRGIAAIGSPAYFALTYDGRVTCRPDHPRDAAVIEAFNHHQRRDKGFGPALGPAAGAAIAHQFAAVGYDVASGQADWHLAADDGELQQAMIAGWSSAVAEMDGIDPASLARWREERRAWVAAGQSEMTVGHLDVWAVPGRDQAAVRSQSIRRSLPRR